MRTMQHIILLVLVRFFSHPFFLRDFTHMSDKILLLQNHNVVETFQELELDQISELELTYHSTGRAVALLVHVRKEIKKE